MGFARSVRTCLAKYGDFSGRASRSEFWWFSLFQFVLMLGLIAMDFTRLVPLTQVDPAAVHDLGILWYATTWGWMVLIMPVWAVSVRRLHDTDRSGWWYLLNIVPLGAIVLFIFYLLPGSRLRNNFGPPPGQADKTAAVYASMAQEPVTREAVQTDLRALRLSRMQGTS